MSVCLHRNGILSTDEFHSNRISREKKLLNSMIVRIGDVKIQLRIQRQCEGISQLVRVAASRGCDTSNGTAIHSIGKKELNSMIARIRNVDVLPAIHGHTDGMIEKSGSHSTDTRRTAHDQRPIIIA